MWEIALPNGSDGQLEEIGQPNGGHNPEVMSSCQEDGGECHPGCYGINSRLCRKLHHCIRDDPPPPVNSYPPHLPLVSMPCLATLAGDLTNPTGNV